MANHYTRQIPDLSEAQRQQCRWVRRSTLLKRFVLETAAGKSDLEVRRLGTTVGRGGGFCAPAAMVWWTSRPPRTIGDDVERVVVQTLEAGATHWRRMAKACGLSAATVSRIWRAFGLKQHRWYATSWV